MAILTSCFDEADQRRREEMHKQRLLMEKELCEKARHDAEEYLRRHPRSTSGYNEFTMNIPLEVEFLILSSALERSREYAARCRRRATQAQEEMRTAEEEVIRKFNELEALRLHILKGQS